MFLLKYFDSFFIYLILLFFSIANTIHSFESLPLLNDFFYLLNHIILIYLGIYYYRFSLFLIFFVCGIILDLSLLNANIGPHLIIFMLLISSLKYLNKYLYKFNSRKILLFIILLLLITVFLEQTISYFTLDHYFSYKEMIRYLLISVVIFYPIFFIFYKIDKIK